ncbi:carbohydrate ABC transporter permease [Paenibacillus daejeonensis]|uniref:carbohydrate ABC transporter permease n=1 Tax=Paenibacillus daejeonensis TaxID=135193 RepID=UPI000372EE9F|nr:carbohydrate ABC transporter permease [Paenibacillus daejeonensis]
MATMKLGWREWVFQIANLIVFTLLLLICLYPFYFILIQSFSDPIESSRNIVALYPLGFTLQNYVEVFALPGLALAFIISVLRTVLGTVISLFFSSIFAYTLMKKELPGRKILYRISILSMYLNAGLIPWYIVMRNYHLNDTFLLYVLPGAVSVFNVILIKTFMENVPSALEESARMDGAGYWTIYSRIMMPLSIPVLAAVAVFTAVGQWNTWMDNLLLINNNKLNTLQYILLQYLNQAEMIAAQVKEGGNAAGYQISPFSLRMTVTMVVTIPVLLVYPIIQRYFVSGIMLGAVKG